MCTNSKPTCRIHDPEWIRRVPPSTERKSHVPSSGFEQARSDGSVENHADLPSLPDLLDELEADVDLNSLEQLTQSLLQDIARDLEAAAQKTDGQESQSNENSIEPLVGQTSAELESSGGAVTDKRSLESDISEYLLLHHNYAAKPPLDLKKRKSSSSKNRKFKSIRSKEHNIPKPQPELPVVPVESEIFFGTLDEATNIVTIIVDSTGMPITENSSEILESTTETQPNDPLTVPSSFTRCLSPLSSSGSESDIGYESLDSPHSNTEDIWDQSISELFPSLFEV